MVAYNTFRRFNQKQKIYKLAHAVRAQEMALAKGLPYDGSETLAYRKYMLEAPEPGLLQAISILDKVAPPSEKNLNLCFHELLELLSEPINEWFYRTPEVRLFDRDVATERFMTAAILDNLRSAFNVGSIFRTSEALGVGELALCGITPKADSIKVARTGQGTVEKVSWAYYSETPEAIRHYKDRGYRIIAVETVKDGLPLYELAEVTKTAFVFGNEEFGIPQETLALCDAFTEIPLVGSKNSLNVASCYAIVMYEVLRRHKQP